MRVYRYRCTISTILFKVVKVKIMQLSTMSISSKDQNSTNQYDIIGYQLMIVRPTWAYGISRRAKDPLVRAIADFGAPR